MSLLEHGGSGVRTHVEEEMAWQATLRPEMDWSMDAELPQRFKVWKRRVTSELRLQMAADPNKQQLWACTYVIVCAGELGENVIQQAKLLEETEDHTKILGALDEFVSPSTHFVEDSFNYFYKTRGDVGITLSSSRRTANREDDSTIQPESSKAIIQAYGGMPVTIVGKCTVIIHKSDGTQTSAVFQVTRHNGHAIIGRSTSTDIRCVNFPAIDCPPLSMTPITHDVQTMQQHVEKTIVTHKTQSITSGNSVADAIKRVSPLSQRPTEDVTPLYGLSDSIAVDQSCLDSVQTEAKKDGTLQQPRNCQATQSTRCSQQQECLSQYEVPAGPWKRLGIDYFRWNQQRYLLIADYYSRFPIIRSVSTMSAAHLVTVLKTIFSEYGLPEELVSDQGTQFTSKQYTSFAKEYNIKITHSSLRYPQSNGFIESMVKITKQILERCKQNSSDPHIAMLLYRATPL